MLFIFRLHCIGIIHRQTMLVEVYTERRQTGRNHYNKDVTDKPKGQ